MNPKQAHDLVGAPLPRSDDVPVFGTGLEKPGDEAKKHQPVNTAREKQARQRGYCDEGQGIRGPGTR